MTLALRFIVTGGPVHAYLDDVKIITNRFRGGMMSALADHLTYLGHDVIYLTTKDSEHPVVTREVVFHNGIDDYMKKVLDYAADADGVVLGGAVANLIPKQRIQGKFPSHNYKPGDTIPIEFTIAPRIIDAVKKVSPDVNLFGFKLLSNVAHDELVRAAYGVLLESKATAVFANDTTNLKKKHIITRERGEIVLGDAPADRFGGLAQFIIDCTADLYYRTELNAPMNGIGPEHFNSFNEVVSVWGERFKQTPEGYVFGTVAIRGPSWSQSFLTTGRGKNELEDTAVVHSVDHENRIVRVTGSRKATLNAPLLDRIFQHDPRAKKIIHFHEQLPDVPTLPYAPAGTVRDAMRALPHGPVAFNIAGHGCFILRHE